MRRKRVEGTKINRVKVLYWWMHEKGVAGQRKESGQEC